MLNKLFIFTEIMKYNNSYYWYFIISYPMNY